MSSPSYKYIFGPVASRRLGLSLGVDPVTFKTCTYDCVYCQLGKTTVFTVERREYVQTAELIEELRRKVSQDPRCDWITFAGSGEPTLHAQLGKIIDAIKDMTSIPVAVITNGSLLWRPDVQDDLLEADLVIPSLDAGMARTFERVNRPSAELQYEKMVEGLVTFRRRFRHALWLEVFLVGNIDYSTRELRELTGHIERIGPDKVQLNTVARPCGTTGTRPVPHAQMKEYARLLGPNVEVIADYDRLEEAATAEAGSQDILALLTRHPCSLPEIAHGLGLSREGAGECLQTLQNQGLIDSENRNGTTFYIQRPAR